MRRNPYYQGPIRAHFDGLRFLNPGLPSTDKSFLDMLRWKWQSRRRDPWHNAPQTQQPPSVPERIHGIQITAIGHASVLIQCAAINLLVDPVWSDRVGPRPWLGPRRWNSPGIPFENLPPIDAVLITHNHLDHLDMPTLARLHAVHSPLVLAPLGNDTIIARALPTARVVALDWWQAYALAQQFTAVLTPAYHWSARGLLDRRMTLWGWFYLQTPKHRLYIAGDTGFGDGQYFRQIRDQMGPPDLALLPIGAYAPRWFMQTVHMDPNQAVMAMDILGATQAFGIHWGTFRLTDEPVLEPPAVLAQALAAQAKPANCFQALTPGQTVHIPEGKPLPSIT